VRAYPTSGDEVGQLGRMGGNWVGRRAIGSDEGDWEGAREGGDGEGAIEGRVKEIGKARRR
jgi:hypothetical protein